MSQYRNGTLGLHFVREQEMPIHYEGFQAGTRRVDFLVEDKIMVEIKALGQLDDTHLSQCLKYLETHNLEIGLLSNFGANKLEFPRLIHERRAANTSTGSA